jgi:heat shock protein HtpX
MFTKLYTLRNICSVAMHYAATAALVVGSLMIGQPWVIGISACLVGGLSYLGIKKQKELLENSLVRHPDIHKFSPRLGKTAEELYKKSGLKEDGYPIYDFRVDAAKMKGNKSVWTALFREMFDLMGQTHNAAALRIGKPVIMISEPLLKLLDDDEEKAVLAHEFAHAVARHNHVGLPQRLFASAASATNGLTRLVAAFAAGWVGVTSAIVAGVASAAGSTILLRKVHGNGKLLIKDDSDLSMDEIVTKRKLTRVTSIVSTVATASVLTYFSPVYLAIYAATKTLSMAGGIVSSTFSRSMEYQADRGAVELGGDPLALITSLRKMTRIQEMSREELFEGKKPPELGALRKAWQKLNASHPTLEKRTGRLADMARKQGKSEALINRAAYGPVHVSKDNVMPYHVAKALMRAV